MFGLDAFHLARIQFAFTVSFHIIFPAITIGLASYLAVLEGLWLKTKNPVWRSLYHFWSKIFAVNFGMGVVSGLVMAYQFGTNWSGFSQFAGSITGPLLTYEVLTAFFLEAGFLGVMLFGWNRVGPGLHFSPPAWWRWALSFPHSGSLPQTAGCKRHKASKSLTVRSYPLIGSPLSLTPPSHTAYSTCPSRRFLAVRCSWAHPPHGICSVATTPPPSVRCSLWRYG